MDDDRSLSPASPQSRSPPLSLSKAPSKRGGPPKAKGSVRAKSGCYTCRIRRKKCDEAQDDKGRCSTCVRLRLQCLGFGQKRPEWLKENNNVSVFREKIKEFLAAQGMIKGHSGTNGRADEAQTLLTLVSDADLQSSESSSHDSPPPSIPPPQTERYRTQQQQQSVSQAYHSLQMPPPSSGAVADGYGASKVYIKQEPDSYSSYNNPYASLSLPPPSQLSHHSHHHLSSSLLVFASTLPASYSTTYVVDEDELTGPYAGASYDVPAAYATATIPQTLSVNVFPQVTDAQNGLVQHYLTHVLYRQYLLADASIQDFIVRTIQHSAPVRDAVCLLASLHQQSLRRNHHNLAALVTTGSTSEDNSTYARICLTLQKTHLGPSHYTEQEALAGLLVVSAFLFRGGRGAWGQFLNVAADFVAAALDRAPGDPAAVLRAASSSQRFVIKTTFWFDILASTTRGQAPRFLQQYRELWAPGPGQQAYIGPPPLGGGNADEISMLSVMGADNSTALALAETAALASWRDTQRARAALSVPELVDRAARIQASLLGARSPVLPSTVLAGMPPTPAEELRIRRRLTANIFRATAKVYLHATVSGDRPRVPEIRAGVGEALAALNAVPAARSALASSVLRSVVFGICLTGCLTDDYRERQIVLQRLDREREEGVGNCDEARRVMELVWQRRDAGQEEVSWRGVVYELGGGETLLLV
ncbi:hypothetical protein PENSPDRAFT_593396 [Peniophora sp. CONT]|nr:hypothetical protein PENSPDRAFT_593396 [Peniophora sp. CONT]